MKSRNLLALATIALCTSICFAQAPATPAPPTAPVDRRPPAGRGLPQGRQDMQDHRRGSDFHRQDMTHGRGGFGGEMAGGFHIAPPGMWWRSPAVVQKLTLTPDQVKKMDDIFQQSRIQLIDLHANLEKQHVLLEPMVSANPPDTAKALSQIDKVAQARADLEKADAKMLLGIRGVLTPDQWTKLRAGGPGGFAGRGAPSDLPPAAGGSGGGGRGPGAGRGGDFVAPVRQQ